MNTNIIPSTMTESEWIKQIAVRPATIISSNSKLKKDGISNITFPAFKGMVSVGGKLQSFTTCPNAGACATYCYARQSTFMFKSSKVKHHRNLQYLLDDPFTFKDQLIDEINKASKRKGFRAFRIGDSGDLNPTLWSVMTEVMKALPHVNFYAYSKQVSMLKDLKAKGMIPNNFTYVLSFGGKEDHLIDKSTDRHSAIFSEIDALKAANYIDASHTDVPASNPDIIKVGLVTHGNSMALHKLKERTNAVLEKSVKLSA